MVQDSGKIIVFFVLFVLFYTNIKLYDHYVFLFLVVRPTNIREYSLWLTTVRHSTVHTLQLEHLFLSL